MEEGKNCAFMSGNGLHIVLAEPMFSINGFSRVQVGTFFGSHFQFFQELNTTLLESTPRKFVVHVESTLYPSISLLGIGRDIRRTPQGWEGNHAYL
jgi:hypothetical protein